MLNNRYYAEWRWHSTLESAEVRHVPSQAAETLNDEERREHKVGSDSENHKKGNSGPAADRKADLHVVKHVCSVRCEHSRGGEDVLTSLGVFSQRGKHKCSLDDPCAPSPLVSLPLVFVFVRSPWCEGGLVSGDSTQSTHRLNDWALLIHLSSPFWSRQRVCSVRVRSDGYSAADCS